jgi:hypothetical protein
MAAMGWYTLWLGFEQLEWCSVGAAHGVLSLLLHDEVLELPSTASWQHRSAACTVLLWSCQRHRNLGGRLELAKFALRIRPSCLAAKHISHVVG